MLAYFTNFIQVPSESVFSIYSTDIFDFVAEDANQKENWFQAISITFEKYKQLANIDRK